VCNLFVSRGGWFKAIITVTLNIFIEGLIIDWGSSLKHPAVDIFDSNTDVCSDVLCARQRQAAARLSPVDVTHI
jgi:hypothetical protein